MRKMQKSILEQAPQNSESDAASEEGEVNLMTSKKLSSLLSILIRLSLVFSAMTVVFPSQITAQIDRAPRYPLSVAAGRA